LAINSLKDCIKDMVPESMNVIRGRVSDVNPLEITAVNDDKHIIKSRLICVPRHLTEYTVECDLTLSGGTINTQTRPDGMHQHGPHGEHPHGPSGGHAQPTGDGVHSHPASEGTHTHPVTPESNHIHFLETFNIFNATIRNYNALVVGDIVWLLSFNHGKRYYVLDREG